MSILLHDRGPKKPMEMQVSVRCRGKVIFGSYSRGMVEGVFSMDHSGMEEVFLHSTSCVLYF